MYNFLLILFIIQKLLQEHNWFDIVLFLLQDLVDWFGVDMLLPHDLAF